MRKIVVFIIVVAVVVLNILNSIGFNLDEATLPKIIYAFSELTIIIVPYIVITEVVLPILFSIENKKIYFILKLVTAITYGCNVVLYESYKVQIFGEDIASKKANPFTYMAILWIVIILVFYEKPLTKEKLQV